ncbi:predicted protein [Micromonas commoda]|uniref:tRNA:m(4)X modification enzyme TRM13 n=1 Tax=Micromonas commoda (strain RCC299 / NOUM17 / CCMP2709) TaxID=296587 RepID=C1EC28_MICCC|nr:predicted protein [Micromonas commoda]ACO65515.1 predicted protein [Micromonas commoda]|eukprot:XP_002504257.1 predicted protein [Micromonas commoda]
MAGAAEGAPPAGDSDPTEPPRCTHVIVKRGKTKTCRQYAKPGTSPPICGNHLHAVHPSDRIPCEHCGTPVLTREMKKHVGKCPAYLRVADAESMPYFARDANLGSDDENVGAEPSSSSLPENEAVRLPRGEELRALVAKVRRACSDAGIDANTPTLEPMSDARCDAAVARLAAAAARASGGGGGVGGRATRIAPFNPRHARQQASIVSHMAAAGLVRVRSSDVPHDDASRSPAYVELGAGRGYLSHFLMDAYGPNDLVLVERRAYRFKAERNIRGGTSVGGGRAGTSGDGSAPASAPGASPGTKVERLRVDIKDLDIAGVEAVKGRDVVVTGKHLCGSATDLALRCCLANTNGGCDGDKSSAAACRVTGVALATCCHHRSDWRSYVNKPFLRDLGFGRDDFPRLARMSSWACDGAAPGVGSVKRPRSPTGDVDEDEHQQPIEEADDGEMSKAEKHEIGGMIKTLIDVGRLRWLNERGLSGRLVGYVDTGVSPENRLIVVSRGEGR